MEEEARTREDDDVLRLGGTTLEFGAHVGVPQGSVFGLVMLYIHWAPALWAPV